MTPAAFDYVRAETLDHALALKAEHGDDASVMAGGQSLVPLLAMRLARPEVVIDIGHLDELAQQREAGGTVTLGALTRHRALERDPALTGMVPLLSAAARYVAYPSVRNRGTLGGAVALGDPAAEYPAVLVALDAAVCLASTKGARDVPAQDFFIGAMETAVADDEIVTGIRVPSHGPRDRFGFYEIAERKGDYALAGAAVALHLSAAPAVRAVLFGIADTPLVVPLSSDVLGSTEAPRAAATQARQAAQDAGAAPLKAHLAAVAMERAVLGCTAREDATA